MGLTVYIYAAETNADDARSHLPPSPIGKTLRCQLTGGWDLTGALVMSQCRDRGSDITWKLLAWVAPPLETCDSVADGGTDGFGSGSRLSLWKGYGVIHGTSSLFREEVIR